MSPVKPQVPTPLPRRERARATRLRITKAASVLFCERGYTATTMADIAEAAGVAVQTVYFAFHTKNEVLSSTYELAVLGEGDPSPPAMQPWYLDAIAEPDVRRAVRGVVEGAGEIVRRATPLDRAVRVAAESDPDVARFILGNEQLRVDGYREVIAFLRAKSELRPELTPVRATDLMLLLVGPAAYRALVSERGWTHAEWVDWTTTAFLEQVFGVRVSDPAPLGVDDARDRHSPTDGRSTTADGPVGIEVRLTTS